MKSDEGSNIASEREKAADEGFACRFRVSAISQISLSLKKKENKKKKEE